MFTDPINFYLIREGKLGNSREDFDKILEYFSTYDDIKFQQKGSSVSISYTQTPLQATLKNNSAGGLKDSSRTQQMTLTCERADNVTVNLLKMAVKNTPYRIFNPLISSYLVNSPDLVDLTTIELNPALVKLFSQYGFVPLFNFQNSMVYFCKSKKDKSIHLVNRHLLEYLLNNKSKLKKQEDFSLKVADSIGTFIALFDRGVIPTSFYSALYKPKGVINLSGFNIESSITSLFVMPVFFILNSEKQSFIQLNNVKFSSGKVLLKKRNSLLRHIAKILKKVSPKSKVLAVKVASQINFEKDEKEKLTPLLVVSVFLDRI